MLLQVLITVANLLGAAIAASSSSSSSSHGVGKREAEQSVAAVAVPPRQDPWYTPTADYESAAEGAILRIRVAPGNILDTVTNAVSAYNILYRSTDTRGLPSWAVTTLLVPTTIAAGPSLLSYQIPYDSADLDASPSYVLSTVPDDGHGAPSYVVDIEKALASGWYVTVADYEGPLASFTAGLQAGYATLDGIRATLGAGKGLAASAARVALTGYSGGALAAEWAAELHPSYAPELNIVGVAAGGLTPVILNVLMTCNRGAHAALDPAGIVGLISQFPDASDYIKSKLKPTGVHNATTFFSVLNMTLDEAVPFFAFQNIYDYFIDGLQDLLDPIVTNLTNSQGRMGVYGTPTAPMFIYKAIGDEVSHINDTDVLINKYCAQGATIDYQRNTVGNHETEQGNGGARAFAFLTQVLGGTYVPPAGCIITNVTIRSQGLDNIQKRKWSRPSAFSLGW